MGGRREACWHPWASFLNHTLALKGGIFTSFQVQLLEKQVTLFPPLALNTAATELGHLFSSSSLPASAQPQSLAACPEGVCQFSVSPAGRRYHWEVPFRRAPGEPSFPFPWHRFKYFSLKKTDIFPQKISTFPCQKAISIRLLFGQKLPRWLYPLALTWIEITSMFPTG